MADSSITKGLQAYSEWRGGLAKAMLALQKWLDQENLIEANTHQQIDRILQHVNDDNLNVAFVAEFSRGKTELINTVFFGQYRERVLPCGAGRTTMCPTELFYNAEKPIGIQLLPIETRAKKTPLHEIKQQDDAWTSVPFSTDDPDKLSQLLKHLTDTIRVKKETALKLDLPLADDENYGLTVDDAGMVEIPRWRHAMINLKHPLLEQKLVILDTPGLNAIGTEPELTLSQLSQAHSIVFVLGSDTGVTKSDLDLWKEHVSLGDNRSRLVALNKIDTLWDQIRSTKEINSEIDKQVEETARILDIGKEQVFPISAQKGLLGKVRRDPAVLMQSRIEAFEAAIAENLIPSKKKIVLTNVFPVAQNLIKNIDSLLTKRINDVNEHREEMNQLHAQNQDVIEHIMQKIKDESKSLDDQTQRFIAIKSVFTKQTNELISSLSLSELEQRHGEAHETLQLDNPATSIKAIEQYLKYADAQLRMATKQAREVDALCRRMHQIFNEQQGFNDIYLRRLDLSRHREKMDSLIQKFRYLKKRQKRISGEHISRFFDSLSISCRRIFVRALNETNDWSRTLLLPLEARVREHKIQLRRRLESVKRIHKSTDTLEARIAELEQSKTIAKQQKTKLYALVYNLNQHLLENSYRDDDEELPDNVLQLSMKRPTG